MQSPGSFLSEKQFQCSICLDIFDNPVSTPCGHSYCMNCIGEYWNRDRPYQCPLCKHSFRKKPKLHINRTLREITEQFKKMKGEAEAWGELGRREVQERGMEKLGLKLPGDLFIKMKHRLLKPYLPSETSSPGMQTMVMKGNYSDIMQPQELMKRLSHRRYTLSGPADSRNVSQCAKHHHKLDLFCKTDGQCICPECGESDHQSHDIVSAEMEWLTSKTKIDTAETKIQEMIGERQRKVDEITLSLEEIKISAEKEKQDSMRVFRALLSSVERSQVELLEAIEIGQRSAEHKAERMIRELELELTELRTRRAELGKLAQTEDCISGLRSYTSHLNTLVPFKERAEVSITFDLGTKSVYSSLCGLLEHFQKELRKRPDICLGALTDISALEAKPMMKKIQECTVDVILDPSTAHPSLIVSEDRKQVRCGDRHQLVSNNPERFDCMLCVLGQEAFTHGRHYWEVEVEGKTDWDLGVACHSINRKGKVNVNPSNGYWFLSLRNETNYNFGTDFSLTIPLNPKPKKIGVFVDYEKGQISFYNVEAKLHIYTFTDTFCEAIYPFFSPCTNKSGKNDAALVITPVLLPV